MLLLTASFLDSTFEYLHSVLPFGQLVSHIRTHLVHFYVFCIPPIDTTRTKLVLVTELLSGR